MLFISSKLYRWSGSVCVHISQSHVYLDLCCDECYYSCFVVCVCSYLCVRLCSVLVNGLLNAFAVCVGVVTVFSLKVIVL